MVFIHSFIHSTHNCWIQVWARHQASKKHPINSICCCYFYWESWKHLCWSRASLTVEEGCKGTIHFPLPQSQSAYKCSPWHLAEKYPSISKDFSGSQRTGGKIVPPLHMDICPEDTALTSQKCNRSDGTAINLTHDFKLINHATQLRNRMQVPLCPQTHEERSLHLFIHSFLLSINSY